MKLGPLLEEILATPLGKCDVDAMKIKVVLHPNSDFSGSIIYRVETTSFCALALCFRPHCVRSIESITFPLALGLSHRLSQTSILQSSSFLTTHRYSNDAFHPTLQSLLSVSDCPPFRITASHPLHASGTRGGSSS